jgi:hypothetical protein
MALALVGGIPLGVGFLRHLLEMTIAMMIGMVVSAGIFVTALGTTVDEALRRHAVAFVLVQVLGMTAPMVAWMRHRRHSWRACLEMATAMVVPAIPLVSLRSAGVISGSVCGLYCASTIAAMVLVMLYRRGEYSGHTVLASAR